MPAGGIGFEFTPCGVEPERYDKSTTQKLPFDCAPMYAYVFPDPGSRFVSTSRQIRPLGGLAPPDMSMYCTRNGAAGSVTSMMCSPKLLACSAYSRAPTAYAQIPL